MIQIDERFAVELRERDVPVAMAADEMPIALEVANRRVIEVGFVAKRTL